MTSSATEVASPDDRARAHGLPYIRPDQAVVLLVRRMFDDFLRALPDGPIRQAVARGYTAWSGAPPVPVLGSKKFLSPYLKGPPGHGKSEVVEQAAREFATLVGLEFTNQIPEGGATKEHFLYVVRELTGETSTLATRGIYERVTLRGSAVTQRVPYADFHAAREAGLALILFDDFSSALEPVKTSLLGLLRRREAEGQDFRSMFLVLTGNLGDSDDTYTTPDGAAIRGRTEMWYLEDTLDAFVARMEQTYSDELGDGLVSAFLEAHPDAFAPDRPRAATDKPWPQPRTWEHVARNMRSLLHLRAATGGGTPLTGPALIDAVRIEASPVGLQHASLFAAFVESALSSAWPLAEALMAAGDGDAPDDVVQQVIAQAGRGTRNNVDGNETAFQQQYVNACATIAATRLLMNDALASNSISRDAAAGVLGAELGRYFCAMARPFLASDGKAAIGRAYQAQGTWTLGRKLRNLPSLCSIGARGDGASIDPVLTHIAADIAARQLNAFANRLNYPPVADPVFVETDILSPILGDQWGSNAIGRWDGRPTTHSPA